tara:strand:- start:235 stop:786 length:552 start_codon:yes stop_codon:yes gene_type:complete
MVLEYARIYKLNSSNGLVYYGSTTQTHLSNRLACHKTNAKNNSDQYTSSLLFADGAEVVITLVENVENCKDKYELQARERWHIQNNQCVNKQVPGRTKKEYHQDNKEHLAQQQKEYREKNKEERAARANEKITCECGAVITRKNLSVHCKTDKHIKKMLELNNNGNVQAAIQQEALATTESAE